jgi:PEGA domain
MKNGRMVLFFPGILAAVALASGCATMKYGPTQIVSIDSVPPGAKVTLQPTGQEFVTPDQVVLKKDTSYIVTIEKEGFQRKSITIVSSASDSLWRNAVWIHPLGWIIGVVVDLTNGSGYDLDPTAIAATLTKSPISSASPRDHESITSPVTPKN